MVSTVGSKYHVILLACVALIGCTEYLPSLFRFQSAISIGLPFWSTLVMNPTCPFAVPVSITATLHTLATVLFVAAFLAEIGSVNTLPLIPIWLSTSFTHAQHCCFCWILAILDQSPACNACVVDCTVFWSTGVYDGQLYVVVVPVSAHGCVVNSSCPFAHVL